MAYSASSRCWFRRRSIVQPARRTVPRFGSRAFIASVSAGGAGIASHGQARAGRTYAAGALSPADTGRPIAARLVGRLVERRSRGAPTRRHRLGLRDGRRRLDHGLRARPLDLGPYVVEGCPDRRCVLLRGLQLIPERLYVLMTGELVRLRLGESDLELFRLGPIGRELAIEPCKLGPQGCQVVRLWRRARSIFRAVCHVSQG